MMPLNRLLVDSSFLIALYDLDADIHEEVVEIAKLYKNSLVIPEVVLTEVVYHLKRESGVKGAAEFLRLFAQASPNLQEITAVDLLRAREIMLHYGAGGTVGHHGGLHA